MTPDKPEAMDRLLLRFFQSELPRTWPGAPNPEAEPAARTSVPVPSLRGSNTASRLALAASVAILMGICWYTSQGTPVPASPIASEKSDLNRAKAEDTAILHEMAKQKTLTEP